jgi:hypothetical protein
VHSSAAELVRYHEHDASQHVYEAGKIRELLGVPELPADRRIDEHDLNEQAWLVNEASERNYYNHIVANERAKEIPREWI